MARKILFYINRFTPLIILVILVVVSENINNNKGYQNGMIESDGKGYYAYLPAVFIYHDLHFGFFDQIERQTYFNEHHFYEYRYAPDGRVINKYYAGTALAMSPFFGLAHLLTRFSSHPADGYSFIYTKLINYAAIFYLFLALIFLTKLLKLYKVRNNYIALILFSIVFGTNVFYYTVVEFSMSHIYSFAFVTLFLLLMKKYFSGGSAGLLLLSGLVLGMVALIRPVNLMVIMVVPFIAGEWPVLRTGLRRMVQDWPYLLGTILIFVAVLSIQAWIYFIQTGHLWVYSYGEEKNSRSRRGRAGR